MKLKRINRRTKRGNSRLYKRKSRALTYVLRTLLVLFTAVVLVLGAVIGAVAVIANGPSDTIRASLVQAAMQASATKWVPGLFLDDEVVQGILDESTKVNQEVISFDDFENTYADDKGPSGSGDGNTSDKSDEWADAKGGMKLVTLSMPNFKAYMLLVRDPSRIYVGTSSDFTDTSVEGVDIYGIVKKEGCVAAVNGGEFSDPGGMGTGNTPIGITYSKGNCVWAEETSKTFIGFDKNNKLVAVADISKTRADQLGIRDGVCFQTGGAENVLISNDGVEITVHRRDGDNARSQRTAIGQRADGTVIMLVTDGRTTSSPGATYNDVIEILIKYGAVTAGMVDGGSSSMLYYEKYYEVYSDRFNYDLLDKYQKRGLVNQYKAFTPPRQIPTFFCISPEN